MQVFNLVEFLLFEGIMLNESTVYGWIFYYIQVVLSVFLTSVCTEVLSTSKVQFIIAGIVKSVFFCHAATTITIMKHTFAIINEA